MNRIIFWTGRRARRNRESAFRRTRTAQVERLEDRSLPSTLSINNAFVVEGNSGTTNAVFTVFLSQADTQTVSVDFFTSDGTASAPSDYQSRSGTLSFAPGETTKTITVPVNGDTIVET